MALLVVLLILALMVMIASNMSGRLQLELRRSANITTAKQAWWHALSAEAMVSQVLAQDFNASPEVVSLNQPWARPEILLAQDLPTQDSGLQRSHLTDLQSCFNLNSLSAATTAESGEALAQQPYPVQVFHALLKALSIDEDEAALLGAAIRDWIDEDSDLTSSLGAEDAYYEGLTPPYLAANQWMLGKDELRAVRGVTAKVYATLAPYVCALPHDRLNININTLTPERPELLIALYLGQLEPDAAKRVLSERPLTGWRGSAALTDTLPLINRERELREALVVKSDFFEAQIMAEVGDHRAGIQTLFQRGKNNKPVILRRLSSSQHQ
ncbi:MAG: type II secretion system minor pseudopilin GspK [Aeromonas sp.]